MSILSPKSSKSPKVATFNPQTKPTGFKRLYKALGYSASGFKVLLREKAFLDELWLLPIIIMIIFSGRLLLWRQLYLFSSYILLLLAEMVNTALESVIDRISLDIHPLSKVAKDIGSAMVLFCLVHLVIVTIALLFL